MLAETAEDVLATKIGHIGPRGVDYLDGSAGAANNTDGLYPIFNDYPYRSLTRWDGDMPDYAKVSAFGAYLVRNYPLNILHDIIVAPYGDERAIVDALDKSGVDKSFDTLLREWGVGVLLSDIVDPTDQPTYNTGDFIVKSYNSLTYELGSINFFNYSPTPYVSTQDTTLNPQANYYYLIGENLTGDINITITGYGYSDVTLIAK